MQFCAGFKKFEACYLAPELSDQLKLLIETKT